MLKSLEKILKILNLEIQSKFTNKAIIGGLDKFIPNWILEAQSDQVPDGLLEQVETHFNTYPHMEITERERSTRAILSLLRQYNSNSTHLDITLPTNSSFDASPATPNGKAPETQTPFPEKPILSYTGSPEVKFGLDAPVSVLPGIGPAKTELFLNLGISRIGDLLYYFPRRYDDFSNLKPINRIEYGEELTVIATVQSHITTPIRRNNQARVEVIVSDGTGFLRLVFFRSLKYVQSFENKFKRGTQLVISGKVTMYLGRLQINNPSYEPLDQTHLNTNGIIPVYPLTSGVTQKELRHCMDHTIKYYSVKIQDYLPLSIRTSAELVNLVDALRQVHYPESISQLKQARDRLAFDEIFFLQLGVQQQKQNWRSNQAVSYEIGDEQIMGITKDLPFVLTEAQRKVISEIRKDLSSGIPMNRLIQGDVGSGKTIVAAIASAAVNLGGGQTALMAPTSILADQHYQTLLQVLSQSPKNHDLPLSISEIRLLTGDTSEHERAQISSGCLDGSIKLLIGTHALIEDPVQFRNLQLAIIDEQHRFGVSQRSALRLKGSNPHLLVMSATPIPRSLALTIFGDLDISVIDEMPAGRKPVATQILHPFAREKAYQIIREQVSEGHQAFIVYPLIEKGDDEEQKAAIDEHAYLQKEVFPDLKLGLLHGKMPISEKDRVMDHLRDKEFDILVSTTVIEVGLDVPNATVMLIEGANRFGLAQLHQLRGRIGRGGDLAYCILIPENEDALENERLTVMIETNDGFVLAEKDLDQRGPGDFIGYRQSGFADLQMAKLTDIRLIEKARHYAEIIYGEDPRLSHEDHQILAKKLNELWAVESRDIS